MGRNCFWSEASCCINIAVADIILSYLLFELSISNFIGNIFIDKTPVKKYRR